MEFRRIVQFRFTKREEELYIIDEPEKVAEFLYYGDVKSMQFFLLAYPNLAIL
jgi:hypothetical protein